MAGMTIKDIAKKCGVGVSTVSRAMNNHPDINQETKDMILRVIAESNYIPNNSARNLQRSDATAIAVPSSRWRNRIMSWMWPCMWQRRKSPEA